MQEKVTFGIQFRLTVTETENNIINVGFRVLAATSMKMTVYWGVTPCGGQHIRRRPSFGQFCASTATCSRQPVSFSSLLYAVSLCAPPAVATADE
jgi:hypothetical protein